MDSKKWFFSIEGSFIYDIDRYMQILQLALLGGAAGVISGLLGIGGAVIIIPALVYFFGYSQLTAQGTSLAMLLPPIGLLAAWRYWHAGNVDVKAAVVLAASFFIFSLLGAQFAVQIPQAIMKRIFAISLVAIGIFMFFEGEGGRGQVLRFSFWTSTTSLSHKGSSFAQFPHTQREMFEECIFPNVSDSLL